MLLVGYPKRTRATICNVRRWYEASRDNHVTLFAFKSPLFGFFDLVFLVVLLEQFQGERLGAVDYNVEVVPTNPRSRLRLQLNSDLDRGFRRLIRRIHAHARQYKTLQ